MSSTNMNKTQSSVCNHQEKCPLMKLLGKLNDPDKNINQTERPSGKLDRKGNVSTTNSRIYKVMVEIRTGYGKSEADMVHLDQHGGVEKLLRIINIAENRISNVTLSLLGNLCMIPACRKKVLTLDGISSVVNLLGTTEEDGVKHRICRTLGNLSLDTDCCSAIHQQDVDIPAKIIALLNTTSNTDYQQTYLRSLRLLADTDTHTLRVIRSGAVQSATKCLESTDNSVLTACLRTLTHLTSQLNEEYSRQFALGDGHVHLLKLCKDVEHSTAGQSLLFRQIKQEHLRPPLVSAGIIDYLMTLINEEHVSPKNKLPYMNAISLCCRESVNRVKLRESGILPHLLLWLKSPEYRSIHGRLLSCLVCFMYDDKGWQQLLDNNLVTVLLSQLRRTACLVSNSCFNKRPPDLTSYERQHLQKNDLSDNEDDNNDMCNSLPNIDSVSHCTGKDLTCNSSEIIPIESGDLSDVDKSEVIQIDNVDDVKAGKQVIYSIDSPTYKQLLEERSDKPATEETCGPENIMDAMDYKLTEMSGGSPYNPVYLSPHCDRPYSPFSTNSDVSLRSPKAGSNLECDILNEDSMLSPGLISHSQSGDQQPECSHQQPGNDSSEGDELFSAQIETDNQNDSHIMVRGEQLALFEKGEENQQSMTQTNSSTSKCFKNQDCSDTIEAIIKTSMISPVSSKRQSRVDKRRTSSNGRKRKRTCSEETQQSIKKRVCDNQKRRSSLQIDTLMSKESRKESFNVGENVAYPMNSSKMTEYNIIAMLSRISFLDNTNAYLCTPDVWGVLLEYAFLSNDPISRCSRIMLRLTANPLCLCPLTAHLIPHMINSLINDKDVLGPEKEKLKELLIEQLSDVALSSFGRGVIENLLIRGTFPLQIRCRISLVYLKKNTLGDVEHLVKYLSSIICTVSKVDDILDSTVMNAATDLLPSLLESLQYLVKKNTSGNILLARTKPRSNTTCSVTKDVVFVLDDGIEVKSCRKILGKESDMFLAMLEGHYSEATQSRICVNGTNSDAFKAMIDFIHGKSLVETMCDHKSEQELLQLLLDVNSLSDFYMLEPLKHASSHYIVDSELLNETSVVKILSVSVAHHSDWLTRHAMLWILKQSSLHCLDMFVALGKQHFAHECLQFLPPLLS